MSPNAVDTAKRRVPRIPAVIVVGFKDGSLGVEGGLLDGFSEDGLLEGRLLGGKFLEGEPLESGSSGFKRIRSILPMPWDKLKLFLQHSSLFLSLL